MLCLIPGGYTVRRLRSSYDHSGTLVDLNDPKVRGVCVLLKLVSPLPAPRPLTTHVWLSFCDFLLLSDRNRIETLHLSVGLQ